MGAEIIERIDVPEVAESGGLFYFTTNGKATKAYRPAELLLLSSRITSAYKSWDATERLAEPLPFKRKRREH